MVTLTQFLVKESQANDNVKLLFESAETFTTVQDVYEAIGMKMLEDETLCEGLGSWLRKLADKGDKLDSKANELKAAAKEKLNKLSDAGKAAIEKVKKEAGEKWDSIKDTYETTVASIDAAMQQTKDATNALAKALGQKVEDIEVALSTIYSNALAEGGELADKVTSFIQDKTKGAANMAALNTFYLGATLAAKAGVDSSTLVDLMSMAGIK